MNRRDPNNGESAAAITRAERLIRAAGKYIEPSDDLRPRVVEAAREICNERRSKAWVLRWSLFCVVCLLLSTFFIDQYAQWHRRTASPSKTEIQETALSISMRERTSLDWGLFEAFMQLRNDQSTKLAPRK